jgi:hypothetical protein
MSHTAQLSDFRRFQARLAWPALGGGVETLLMTIEALPVQTLR